MHDKNIWTCGNYKTVIDAYKEFYPEDRLDIEIIDPNLRKHIDKDKNYCNLANRNCMSCTVYYPKITLTNENNKTHDITDVYVRVCFPDLNIYLGRTSYTKNEIRVGYVHSHVHTGGFYGLSLFCLGGINTPINIIRNRIKNDFEGRNDDEKFKLTIESFIIEVERTIKVESIDGGPYIKFSKIKEGVRRSNNPIFIKPCCDRLLLISGVKSCYTPAIKNFFIYYASLRLDTFYYDGRNWQLKCSDYDFIKKVTRVAKVFSGTRSKSTLFTRVLHSNNNFYTENVYNNGYRLDRPYADWSFKGHLPKMICIDNKGKENKVEFKNILNPIIIGRLYNFLLDIINSVYANERYKDSVHSRTLKVIRTLVKSL
nr:MAG TPA: hypothetical protein [Caudoviricetes sp.]